MGKMSRISYLCETDNMKELIEEVGTELAQGFMLAHKEMRSKINDPAFSKLNEITDEMQEKYRNEESRKKTVSIRDINKEIAKEMKEAVSKISAASVGIRDDMA